MLCQQKIVGFPTSARASGTGALPVARGINAYHLIHATCSPGAHAKVNSLHDAVLFRVLAEFSSLHRFDMGTEGELGFSGFGLGRQPCPRARRHARAQKSQMVVRDNRLQRRVILLTAVENVEKPAFRTMGWLWSNGCAKRWQARCSCPSRKALPEYPGFAAVGAVHTNSRVRVPSFMQRGCACNHWCCLSRMTSGYAPTVISP